MPLQVRGRTALLLPVLALAAVCALDAVQAARSWPVPVVGLLDEPAHLLTAWLALAAIGCGTRAVAPWVLVGAVAVDVDHIPLYLWSGPVAHPGSRPVTHSALTVVVLLALAAGTRSRTRTALAGSAAGVVLHLVRDVAGGPGIPLLWPLDGSDVRLPYGAYLAVLVLATGVAVLQAARQRRRSHMNGRR